MFMFLGTSTSSAGPVPDDEGSISLSVKLFTGSETHEFLTKYYIVVARCSIKKQ
jgi:hypothetical protein